MRTHRPRTLLFDVTFHTGTLLDGRALTFKRDEINACLNEDVLYHRKFRIDLVFGTKPNGTGSDVSEEDDDDDDDDDVDVECESRVVQN